jgi:hypothetical protein
VLHALLASGTTSIAPHARDGIRSHTVPRCGNAASHSETARMRALAAGGQIVFTSGGEAEVPNG